MITSFCSANSVLPSMGNDSNGSSEVQGNDSERGKVT